MATTLRIPEPLQAEAAAYAAALGISLNGLIAVSLRDYLDQRKPGQVKPATSAPVESPAPEPVAPPLRATEETFKPPKHARAPCPCGSKLRWRDCHGKGK